MALVDPGKAAPVGGGRAVHPVVFFLAGFGLIVLAAALVHALFGLLL